MIKSLSLMEDFVRHFFGVNNILAESFLSPLPALLQSYFVQYNKVFNQNSIVTVCEIIFTFTCQILHRKCLCTMHECNFEKIIAEITLQIINASFMFYTWQDVEFQIHFHFILIIYFSVINPIHLN